MLQEKQILLCVDEQLCMKRHAAILYLLISGKKVNLVSATNFFE